MGTCWSRHAGSCSCSWQVVQAAHRLDVVIVVRGALQSTVIIVHKFYPGEVIGIPAWVNLQSPRFCENVNPQKVTILILIQIFTNRLLKNPKQQTNLNHAFTRYRCFWHPSTRGWCMTDDTNRLPSGLTRHRIQLRNPHSLCLLFQRFLMRKLSTMWYVAHVLNIPSCSILNLCNVVYI